MINPYIIGRRTVKTVAAVPTKVVDIAKKPVGVEEPELAMTSLTMPVLHITRLPKTIILNVQTTPTLILQPPHEWPYILVNPSLLVGGTASALLYSGTVSTSGNTQVAPLGVANYLQCHFYLIVTAVTGVWDIISQTRDPVTGNWVDSQMIFSGINAVGSYYASVGSLGIVTDLAVRWNPTTAGSMTFSITATLKEGTVGSGTGIARTIFLGGPDVTVDTGLPLFESEKIHLRLGPDIKLYAIAGVVTPIKVFII